MDNEQTNFGIMEDWNNGILDKRKTFSNALFQYSTIPMFQRVWFIVSLLYPAQGKALGHMISYEPNH